jgi:hypothetical protein
VRKRIAGAVAGLVLASAAAVATSPSASATDCHYGTAGGRYGKICLNGFTSSDWPSSAQFLAAFNGYRYDVKFKVLNRTGDWYWDCIGAGTAKWYDRDTWSVSMSILRSGGVGLPVRC